MRRTLEGTKRKRQNVSGFRARMSTPGGKEVINRRRARGRHKVAITAKKRAQCIIAVVLKYFLRRTDVKKIKSKPFYKQWDFLSL